MSIHAFLDKATVALGGLYGDALRFFRDSVQSPHVSKMIEDVEMEVPAPKGPGEVTVPLEYGGEEHSTAYFVWAWHGPSAPTIIFHHGSGDYPYQSRIQKVFPDARKPAGVNLIATTIPFNRTGKMEYIRAVGSLQNFSLMFAAGTRLIEGLVRGLGGLDSSARVCVSGISLGGWITNMHKAYFDSASEYRPIFAGAAPDHLFRDTVYAKMAAAPGREHPEAITEALNFEADFEKVDNHNVFPLMGRFDQYIVLDRQSRIYRPENVTVIDYGHVTGTMQNETIAAHIADGSVAPTG